VSSQLKQACEKQTRACEGEVDWRGRGKRAGSGEVEEEKG